jgi:hypothetical protein
MIIRKNTGDYAMSVFSVASGATKTPHPAYASSENSLENGTGNLKQIRASMFPCSLIALPQTITPEAKGARTQILNLQFGGQPPIIQIHL